MPMFCGNCGGKLEEGQQFCSGCGQKVEVEIKLEEPKPSFCGNCGGKLEEGQQFCSGCGHKVNANISSVISQTNKPVGDYATYKMVAGIIMIIMCICILSAGLEYGSMLTFILPGLLGMVAAIMTICSRTNKKLFKPAGIVFIVGAVVNFFGNWDISIYAILAILFGTLNIVYSNMSK